MLAFASKALGHAEQTGDFKVRKMLKGWARKAGPRRNPRQPITLVILRGLRRTWQTICSLAYEACLFHAAAFLAFFAAL